MDRHLVPLLTRDPVQLPAHSGFADDLAVVATHSTINAALQIFVDYCNNFGLTWNVDKTVIRIMEPSDPQMTTQPTYNWKITASDGTIHNFAPTDNNLPSKYLGIHIHDKQIPIAKAISLDLDQKIQIYRGLNLSAVQRRQIINSVLIPQVVYKVITMPHAKMLQTLEEQILEFQRYGDLETSQSCSRLTMKTAFAPRKQMGLGLHYTLHSPLCLQKIYEPNPGHSTRYPRSTHTT